MADNRQISRTDKMQLGRCDLKNFSSYENLSFDFRNKGLLLVHGATGSGKSTFQDIPMWILYGTTAKNGSVDEVRRWGTTNSITQGTLEVYLKHGSIKVTRIRASAKENDLFWEDSLIPNTIHRGKDLIDTQRLLEDALGVSAELYNNGAYFNEFSESGRFFYSSAKLRRNIFEKLANLSFPTMLTKNISETVKTLKSTIKDLEIAILCANNNTANLSTQFEKLKQEHKNWKETHDKNIREYSKKLKTYTRDTNKHVESLRAKSYQFEDAKNKQIQELISKIDALDEIIIDIKKLEVSLHEAEHNANSLTSLCKKCRQPVPEYFNALTEAKDKKLANERNIEHRSFYTQRLKTVQRSSDPFIGEINSLQNQPNPYLQNLAEERKKVNPLQKSLVDLQEDLNNQAKKLTELTGELQQKERHSGNLVKLQQLTAALYKLLLERAVKGAETLINKFLETYFESEFKITFDLVSADTLDVSIHKNSYPCSYSQLSKGQRQILKLSFVVAIMQLAANEAGVHFSSLFFDEALDGLDNTMKLKALNLFEELCLSHESVFLIDHTENLKESIPNQITVELIEDRSVLSVTNE